MTAAGTALLPACTLRARLSRLPGNRARPVLRGRGRGNASPLPAEVFFSIITRQAIRRGSFDNVKELTTAIRAFIAGWNDRCHPFIWTKTADELLPHTRKRDSDAGH